jgi:CMP/dCMP kinase
MIITLDGPVASGKSTVARLLAEQLGYTYLNSGLLFRALAYLYLRDKQYTLDALPTINVHGIEKCINEGHLHYTYTHEYGAQIILYDTDITSLLKNPLIDQGASIISTHPGVRQALLMYQRSFAQGKDIVVDGRDSGTVVFPEAQYKFYLTASVEVRAQRWQRDQQAKGNDKDLEECIAFIQERDTRDSTRSIAPLKPAADALIIDTSTLTLQDVVGLITTIIRT